MTDSTSSRLGATGLREVCADTAGIRLATTSNAARTDLTCPAFMNIDFSSRLKLLPIDQQSQNSAHLAISSGRPCAPARFFSKFKQLPPVILERKLKAIIVDVESLNAAGIHNHSASEVQPPAPLELAADRNFGNRVIQQVGKSVVSLMKIIRRLRVGVIDVQHRIADRRAEFVAPVVIQE